MRTRVFVPILCALLAPAALAPSLTSQAGIDTPVTLKYVYKVGNSQHQQMLIKAMVQGIDATVKQTRKTLVKEIKDTGEVTVVETDEGGTLTLMGNDQHQDPGPDITVKRDKLGKLTDWKPAADLANSALSPEVMRATSQLYSVIFPDMAVKEKDTWKLELDNPIYDKMKIKVENTYIGIEKVDGVDHWKIKQTATVPTDGEGGVSTFEGTFWLKTSNGQLAKLDGNVKDVPSQFGKLSFSVLVTPVKDDKPATDSAKAPQPK